VLRAGLFLFFRNNEFEINVDRSTYWSARARVDAALSGKVADQRRSLESELSKLSRFQGGAVRGKVGARRGFRGAVAPKYRNPELLYDNLHAAPQQAWVATLQGTWLAAAIKAGKKQDDFLIAAAAPSSKANGRKKARKARK
jgi:hypothetical protein